MAVEATDQSSRQIAEENFGGEPWHHGPDTRFIRCGEGRVDGVKIGRTARVDEEKNASIGKTRKRVKTGGQR